MKEVVNFLTANPVQYLATQGEDGKPKVRPFMFSVEREGRLWFCTNIEKDVYKQLRKNPWVEVCVSDPSFAWLRLSGRAVFEDNRDVKEACMGIPLVKGIYGAADNPIFTVFYLDEARAVLADFSGQPPKTYNL